MAQRFRSLAVLDARIEARAEAMRAEAPWWPCAKGCDHCCRSLPHLPTITAAEWERLAPALTLAMRERILGAEHEAAPVTCPLLDRDRGECLVYEHRPIACRTYGYFTERDAGLHCELVTRAVEQHEDALLVWGNGEAIAAELGDDTASLAEWLRRG